jgi:hypothetical protein
MRMGSNSLLDKMFSMSLGGGIGGISLEQRKNRITLLPLDLRETNIKLQKSPSRRAGYGGLGLTVDC